MLLSFWSTCPNIFLTQLLRSFVRSNTGSLRVNWINMDGRAPKPRWTHWEFAAKAPVEPFGSWTKKFSFAIRRKALEMIWTCRYDLRRLVFCKYWCRNLAALLRLYLKSVLNLDVFVNTLATTRITANTLKNPVLSTRNLSCNSSEVGSRYSLEIERGTWQGNACLSSLPSIVARWRLVASS